MSKSRPIIIPPPPQDNYNIWAMLCHLSPFVFFVFPFGFIVAPLLIWLIKKPESSEVDFHGAESINFQISTVIFVIILALLSALLIFLNGAVALIFFCIGLVVLMFYGVICMIIAAVKAYNRLEYRYPVCFRFIKAQ
jgi:uncharacterized Tic20 family protein